MAGGLKDRSAGAVLPQQGSLLPAADLRAGHRQRLKERFTSGGPEALPDYELLELVLFGAIPRRDTKEAKRLLERSGPLRVINAPSERLKEIKGRRGYRRHAPEAGPGGGPALDARQHHAAPRAGVVGLGAGILPCRHGVRGTRAVPHPFSR